MHVLNSDKDIHKFLNHVAVKKRDIDDCQFLHVAIPGNDDNVQFGEVEQLLEFHVQDDDAWLLRIPEKRELVLVTNKSQSLMLTKIEKSFYENFSSDTLHARVRGLDGDGLEKFSEILKPHVNQNDEIARVNFKRMSRLGNSMLVLDDDLMVLKQLEKLLSGYGNVVTLQEPDEFMDNYKKIAPDIVFLDIHLRTAKGNEILKDLTTNVDPFAHVVMISSDTKEDIILDIKQGGAKGFVVKPFSREKIHQQIIKAPTFSFKKTS